ncbi:MAG: DUF896 domain-containing protein [Clostridiales bacterium]|nr:DUF896 domain-containing protein [Clostridiales bacterium]MCD7828239.1 DUF896 domain-containing protein [Clostridiales bacterium]
MEQSRIDRINELARKSKTSEGLTAEEKAEQQRLRQEYVAAIKASLTGQLDHMSILKADGTVEKVSKRKKK